MGTVCKLNLNLENYNADIAGLNKLIDDMQEPRRVLQKQLSDFRNSMNLLNENSRLEIYKLQRRVYEIERKLEEYSNRNCEIEEISQQTLQQTLEMVKLNSQIDEQLGTHVRYLSNDEQTLLNIKREQAKTVNLILQNGHLYSELFKEFFNNLMAELNVLISVES